MPESAVTIRQAHATDAPTIYRFIRELADFERALDQVQVTVADLLRDGWGLDPEGLPLPGTPPARFGALIAEWRATPDEAPEAVGFALFFRTYSTWVGHHGVRLEDLYVTPLRRRHGIGKALLAHLARIALEEGCSRLEWDVLTWNESAIAMYHQLGAITKDDWHVMRLAGQPLKDLADLVL